MCKGGLISCDEKVKNLAINSIITDKTKIKKSTKERLVNIIKFDEG